nr:hypothetical protein [Dinophyceae sp. MRD-151]
MLLVVSFAEFIDNLDVAIVLRIPRSFIKVITFSICMFLRPQSYWKSIFVVIKRILKTFIEILLSLVSYEIKKY